MKFVVGLIFSIRGFDSIYIIVDQWTKPTNFLLNHTANRLSHIYLREFICLRGDQCLS